MTRIVCLFTDSHALGGAEHAMLALAARLDRRRWRPVLAHTADESSPLPRAAKAMGIPCLPFPEAGEGAGGLVRVPQLARRLRTLRPSVFHAHLTWQVACRNPLAAARVAGVPAVVATHHLFVDIPMPLSRRIQQRLVGTGVSHIAVSADLRDRLEQTQPWIEGRVRVIRNWVETERFVGACDPELRARMLAGEGSARSLVLVPARLEIEKGLLHLMAAAQALPDVRFLLAGTGTREGEFRAEAARRGLTGRVVFLGSRDDIPALMAASDLVVLPSLVEALPLVALEAMAAGRPIVATRVGGVPEAIIDGETGVLVPPGSPDALVAAIEKVIAEPGWAAELGNAGRRRVAAHFGPEDAIAATCAVYDESLAGTRKRRR